VRAPKKRGRGGRNGWLLEGVESIRAGVAEELLGIWLTGYVIGYTKIKEQANRYRQFQKKKNRGDPSNTPLKGKTPENKS